MDGQGPTVDFGQRDPVTTPLGKLNVLQPQLQVSLELFQGTLHGKKYGYGVVTP